MPNFLKGTKLKFKLSSMFQTLPPIYVNQLLWNSSKLGKRGGKACLKYYWTTILTSNQKTMTVSFIRQYPLLHPSIQSGMGCDLPADMYGSILSFDTMRCCSNHPLPKVLRSPSGDNGHFYAFKSNLFWNQRTYRWNDICLICLLPNIFDEICMMHFYA